MLISRAALLLRSVNNIRRGPQRQILRNSHDVYYRSAPPEQKEMVKIAEYASAFAWWWVLWHLWTEPGHIFGEFEYPDPSQWTDEELGIEN